MPRYDYRCRSCSEVTEAVRGYSVSSLPCTACGQPAERVAVYLEQTIRGETVAKPRLDRGVLDKKGRFRLGLATEAQHEIIYDCEKAGVKPPDFFGRSKARARQIAAAS